MSWTHGLCSCYDIENCLCAYFCYPCLIYKSAEGLHKNGFLYMILACFAPCVPTILLRSEARQQYEIEGSTLSDVINGMFCPFCSTVQLANEIKEQGNKRIKKFYVYYSKRFVIRTILRFTLI